MKFKKITPAGFDFFFSLKNVEFVRHLDKCYTTAGDLFFEFNVGKVDSKIYPRNSFGEGKKLFPTSPIYGWYDNKPPYSEFHTIYGADSISPKLGVVVSAPLSLVKKPPTWVVYEVMVTPDMNASDGIHPAIYIGQTTKGLMHRIRQHLAECRTSNVRFKRYMRSAQGAGQLSVRVLAHGYDGGSTAAIDAETRFILAAVKHASESPEKLTILNTSLNSGVFVNRIKQITDEDVLPEDAEERHSQLVWAGKTWMGDVERTIGTVCNNPNNFSVDEVEQLIMLRDIGYDQAATARVMDCSVRRVQDFFNRKTYQFLQLPEAA